MFFDPNVGLKAWQEALLVGPLFFILFVLGGVALAEVALWTGLERRWADATAFFAVVGGGPWILRECEIQIARLVGWRS